MSFHGKDVLEAVDRALSDKAFDNVGDIRKVFDEAFDEAKLNFGESSQLVDELAKRSFDEGKTFTKDSLFKAAMRALGTLPPTRKNLMTAAAAAIDEIVAVAQGDNPRVTPRLTITEDQAPRLQTIMTPTGPLSVLRPVAERLLKEGVITGALDGALRATDAAIVKAAMIQESGICDFCGAPGIARVIEVPDFELLPGNISVGGWGACEVCEKLIGENKRKQLLDRAMEGIAFPKFSRKAVEELFEKFWKGKEQQLKASTIAIGLLDYIDHGQPQHPLPEGLSMTPREIRIQSVMKVTKLTRAQVDRLIDKKDFDNETFRRLMRAGQESGVFQLIDQNAGPRKPLPPIVPHWQTALDMQYDALKTVTASAESITAGAIHFRESTDMNDPKAVAEVAKRAARLRELRAMHFEQDVEQLRRAEAYSFNGETISAIEQAAASIPHDAPLSSIETPNTGAGWFWFAEPIDTPSSPQASPYTHALLWGWTDFGGKPAIRFSTYVVDELTGEKSLSGHCLPATRWYWPLELSFHDMLGFASAQYDESYQESKDFYERDTFSGKEATLAIIGRMSLFFLMSCVWFTQRVPVLTKEPGHVERHARKRMQREHKLDDAPTVRVIALRKSLRTPGSGGGGQGGDGAKREYHFRWIVSGHARLQKCGPGRKDVKLIWIDAYPKGPEDKPLKVKTKVYAVVR